jgi:hypothetical protein
MALPRVRNSKISLLCLFPKGDQGQPCLSLFCGAQMQSMWMYGWDGASLLCDKNSNTSCGCFFPKSALGVICSERSPDTLNGSVWRPEPSATSTDVSFRRRMNKDLCVLLFCGAQMHQDWMDDWSDASLLHVYFFSCSLEHSHSGPRE